MKQDSVLAKIMRRAAWVACRVLPVKKNKIVASSYYGRGYSDNIKYIVEKLLGKGYDIVWLTLNEKEAATLPSGVRSCRFRSAKAAYELSTASVWVDNCRKFARYKKPNQLFIETWHGGGAQKKSEKDVVETLGPGYGEKAMRDSSHFDIMLSDSRFQTELYYRSFWYSGHVAEIGYPRYDIIYEQNAALVKKVHAFYGIPADTGIVVYAPTFRRDHSFAPYAIDYPRLLGALKTRFGRNFAALVHLHPNVANGFEQIQYDGKTVINATYYPDMQELIAASDVMISDYSSVNFDFCLTGKPALRFCADLEAYAADRNFYYDITEYPFPMATDNDGLCNLIESFDEEAYRAGLRAFFDKIGFIENHTCAQTCADMVEYYIRSDLDKEALFAAFQDCMTLPDTNERSLTE